MFTSKASGYGTRIDKVAKDIKQLQDDMESEQASLAQRIATIQSHQSALASLLSGGNVA